MPLDKEKEEVRLLLSKNSSFDNCINKINEYKNHALSLNDKNHAAYADYYAAQLYINRGSILKAQQLIQAIIPVFKKTNNINFLQAS